MSSGAPESNFPFSAPARPRWTQITALAAVCALIIGFYATTASPDLLEFAVSGPGETYYNLLVRGFQAGQLNLKREAPPGLAQLPDPYDPDASQPYRFPAHWDQSPPLHDISYFKGKLYLYFGVTPALALFWPYAALTGHFLFQREGLAIFLSVGFLTSAGLLWAVWRRYFAEVNFGVVLAGVVALGLANFTPPILRWCGVCEVAIGCGYAFMMLALAGVWRAMHHPRRRGIWLAGASLAYGLAIGARPSLLPGAVILLLPMTMGSRGESAGQGQGMIPPWPRLCQLLLAAIAPILCVGAGLLAYNALRFGDPFEFGQRYQLSGFHQSSMEQFSLRYLWFNFRVGWLAPALWSAHLPFVHEIALPRYPRGYLDVDHAFGVLSNIPVIWLALASPLGPREGPAEARSALLRFLAAVGVLFAVSALVIGLHNSICLRYELEFASPLLFLSVIGIFNLERAFAGQPSRRWAARCVWISLLAFSVAFNLLASVQRLADAQTSFGYAQVQQGQVEDAIGRFQKACGLQPDNADAHVGLGSIYLKSGRLDEAIGQFQIALRIDPRSAEARKELGYSAWALATSMKSSVRDGTRAVQLAQQANELAGKSDPEMMGILAAAYAEARVYGEAVSAGQRAAEMATAQTNEMLAKALRNQVNFYKAGFPLRDPRLTNGPALKKR